MVSAALGGVVVVDKGAHQHHHSAGSHQEGHPACPPTQGLALRLRRRGVIVIFVRPVAAFFVSSAVGFGLYLFNVFLPFILLCPLYSYAQRHPVNLILLGLFTLAISFAVGLTCAFTSVPMWVAVMIGLIMGWAWRPRWASFFIVGVRSFTPPCLGALHTVFLGFPLLGNLWAFCRLKKKSVDAHDDVVPQTGTSPKSSESYVCLILSVDIQERNLLYPLLAPSCIPLLIW